MARLNEPPVSMDNFETLRRKFLRQNREIARINSSQSLRIRELENDCARMLSENLDLRGQVLHLQKELESNSSSRVADHALEVKAKMEVQLAELGSLLAGLGLEPPRKRHSPSRPKPAESRSGFSRSPRQKKLRNLAKDPEAAQEGRLPPIHEHKPYPRATMNSEEIRALCTEAADTSGSPDLGPPPVSRFVDDDPVKSQSPKKSTEENTGKSKAENVADDDGKMTPTPLPPPKLDFNKKPTLDGEAKQLIGELAAAPARRGRETKPEAKLEANPEATVVIPQALRVGSKRKFGDENEIFATAKPLEKPSLGAGTGKDRKTHDIQKRRSMKALSAAGRETKGKGSENGAAPTTNPPRRALAMKSTNDDVSSPKKPARCEPPAEVKPGKRQNPRRESTTEPPSRRTEILPPDAASTPPSTTTIPEAEAPPSESPPFPPRTPEPSQSAPREAPRDTPPPADISSMGEAMRPSRRARTSISYAEPNLRDKMRRPTKELFDAVAGEGRYAQKPGLSKSEDAGSAAPPPKSGSESKPSANWKDLPPADALAKESARRQSALSPLAQKEPATADPLPTTVVTDRRKRVSSYGDKESSGTSPEEPESRSKPAQDASASTIAAKTGIRGGDVYDFTTSSPVSETKYPGEDKEVEEDAINVRQPTRNTRRTSTASAPAKGASSSSEILTAPAKTTKSSGSRKRASMAAGPKGGVRLDPDDAEESLGDDEGGTSKGRVSRRRSMMI